MAAHHSPASSSGSQSSIFAVPDDISERATAAPQAVRRVTGQPAGGRPISPPPPQLARLYEAYVYGHGSEAVESRPTAGPATLAAAMADMADVRTSPHPAPVEMPAPASGVAAASAVRAHGRYGLWTTAQSD